MTPSFPPDPTRKEGFYPYETYAEALARYPSVVALVREKAREHGDRLWLTFQDGRRFSYGEVDVLSGRLAAGLRRLGVERGDRVAIFAFNSPEWLLAYFGILKAGAVPVTVNTGFVRDPLAYNLRQADVGSVVVDVRLAGALQEVLPGLPGVRRVIAVGGDGPLPEGWVPWAEVLAAPEPLEEEAPRPHDPAAMILTSGTTGPSKVVVETHAQFISTALFMIDAGGITPESVVYVYLPLFHIMALDLASLASMLASARMVLVERFDPARFWEDIRRYGATHFHAVGPILEMLLKQPPRPEEADHPPLVAIAYASKEVWERASRRFGLRITGGYGSTEAGIPVSSPYDRVAAGRTKPGGCGYAGPHVEVAIMDEEGQFLPPGRVGEIVLRPRLPWAIFREYYRMPEQTLAAFRGLWFHTGDAGYLDEDGCLFFVDRLKDAIRRRGENISSYEVEQVLLGHPGVREVAVVPVPAEVGEDEVCAVVVPATADLTPEALVDYALEHMPRFWVPRFVHFVDALPKTPTGRVEKYRLRRPELRELARDMGPYIAERLRRAREAARG